MFISYGCKHHEIKAERMWNKTVSFWYQQSTEPKQNCRNSQTALIRDGTKMFQNVSLENFAVCYEPALTKNRAALVVVVVRCLVAVCLSQQYWDDSRCWCVSFLNDLTCSSRNLFLGRPQTLAGNSTVSKWKQWAGLLEGCSTVHFPFSAPQPASELGNNVHINTWVLRNTLICWPGLQCWWSPGNNDYLLLGETLTPSVTRCEHINLTKYTIYDLSWQCNMMIFNYQAWYLYINNVSNKNV